MEFLSFSKDACDFREFSRFYQAVIRLCEDVEEAAAIIKGGEGATECFVWGDLLHCLVICLIVDLVTCHIFFGRVTGKKSDCQQDVAHYQKRRGSGWQKNTPAAGLQQGYGR